MTALSIKAGVLEKQGAAGGGRTAMETCSRNGCPQERGGRATEDGVGLRKRMVAGVGGSKR